MLKSVSLKVIVIATVAVALYVACGKNSTSPENVTATKDLSVGANPTTTPALFTQPLVFSTGVPELGMSSKTTLTFSANPADSLKPLFSIVSTEDKVTGTTTFGSCIFTVLTSTTGFLAVGKSIRIDPCTMNAKMTGATIDKTTNSNVTLLLGKNSSVEVAVPLTVSADGTVKFKSNTLGTVTLSVPTTGAH